MHSSHLLVLSALLASACDQPTPTTCDDDASNPPAAAAVVPEGMPIEPVTVRPWGPEEPYRYQIDEAALAQAMILAHGGELPVEAAPRGRVRVLAAAPGSLLEQAGLRVGDEIVTLAAKRLDDEDLAAHAYRAWRSAGRLVLTIERNGEPLTLTYTSEGPPPPPVEDAGVADDGKDFVAHDRGGGLFELSRADSERLFSDQSRLLRSARIVPARGDGGFIGLRLYGVRPGSPLAQLGLKNGDVVVRVGGFDVSAPDKALEAYAKLRGASEVKVEIVRRGAPMTLTYRVIP